MADKQLTKYNSAGVLFWVVGKKITEVMIIFNMKL